MNFSITISSWNFYLAYLMKYKQMSLRDAFHYLRSRRHIIGPNFGFIKQVFIQWSSSSNDLGFLFLSI